MIWDATYVCYSDILVSGFSVTAEPHFLIFYINYFVYLNSSYGWFGKFVKTCRSGVLIHRDLEAMETQVVEKSYPIWFASFLVPFLLLLWEWLQEISYLTWLLNFFITFSMHLDSLGRETMCLYVFLHVSILCIRLSIYASIYLELDVNHIFVVGIP